RHSVRPTESRAEILKLEGRRELNQPEQVGAGRSHRPTDVVLAQPLQLPQQHLASAPEIVVQVRLCVQSRHSRKYALAREAQAPRLTRWRRAPDPCSDTGADTAGVRPVVSPLATE